jgi:hypothetical protein
MGGMSELHAMGMTELPSQQPPRQAQTDVDAVKAFLDLVGITTDELVSQTYQESGAANSNSRGRTYKGLASLAEVVRDHNENALAVAIMANPITGNRRIKAAVKCVQRIVVDFDARSAAEDLRNGISPTAVVRTSLSGWHLWLVLDRPLSVIEGEALARKMASAHGADQKACDAAHVYRLPGTWNRKPKHGQPFLVEHVGGSGQIVSTDALLSAYPLIEEVEHSKSAAKPAPRVPLPSSSRIKLDALRTSLTEAISYIPMNEHDEWLDVGRGLHEASGGADWGFAIWLDQSSKSPKFSGEADHAYRWSRMVAGPGITKETVYFYAKMHKCDVVALGRKYPSAGTRTSELNTDCDGLKLNNNGGHHPAPNARYGTVLYDSFTASERLVHDFGCHLHNGRNNGAIPASGRSYAKHLPLHRDTISKAIKGLCQKGAWSERRRPAWRSSGAVVGLFEIAELGTDFDASLDGGRGVYRSPPKLVWTTQPRSDGSAGMPAKQRAKRGRKEGTNTAEMKGHTDHIAAEMNGHSVHLSAMSAKRDVEQSEDNCDDPFGLGL